MSRTQLSRGVVLGVVASCVAVALLATCAIKSQYDLSNEARNGECIMRLKQIALALLQYHDKYGTLPPAAVVDEHGKPAHSWRVLILPFLGHDRVYEQYDFSQPWDGPTNRRLQAQLRHQNFSPYHCANSALDAEKTNYVAITDSSTMWPTVGREISIDKGELSERPEILVVEVPGAEISWMEPRDLSLSVALSMLADDEKHHPVHSRGVWFVDTAQSVKHLPRSSDISFFAKLLKRAR